MYQSVTKTPKPKTHLTLITVAANDIARGDLLHYNASTAWRVEGVSHVGKSIDVTFVCERSELEPAAVGVPGDHRFRQTTNVLVLRRLAAGTIVPAPVTVPAGELNTDDVIHYNAAQSWRVSALNPCGKSVDVDFVVTASELDPAAVGTVSAHRFRQSTNLLVTRIWA